VEKAVVSQPAVLEAAVIAVPDDRWGERPKAFVVLKQGATASGEEIIAHVQTCIARFKEPDRVELLEALPETATGKIQKFVFREAEWRGREKRVYWCSDAEVLAFARCCITGAGVAPRLDQRC